jgi:hypothetical protein
MGKQEGTQKRDEPEISFEKQILDMLTKGNYHKVIRGSPAHVLRRLRQEEDVKSGVVYIQTRRKNVLEASTEYMHKIQTAMAKNAILLWKAKQNEKERVNLVIVKKKLLDAEKLVRKNVNDYYKLAQKIIKSGILTYKESSRLAVMFSDAASNFGKGDQEEVDALYDKLLSLSIKLERKMRAKKPANKKKKSK